MCNPMFALLAITAATGAAQQMQQRQVNKSMQSALDNEAVVTTQAAAEQRTQLNAQASDEMSERARSANIERARLNVAAGEAGVSGASVDALNQESFFNEEHSQANILENLENRKKQSVADERGALARIQSSKNQFAVPTRAGMALSIGGSTAAAFFGAKARAK